MIETRRLKNVVIFVQIIIAHVNIESLRNKFDSHTSF